MVEIEVEFEARRGTVTLQIEEEGIWMRSDNGVKHMTPTEMLRITEDPEIKDKILLG